ncbi:aminotransferase class I/II-fold pyridoxal phosphate-dependent enzyme [Candidatus Paracaedibacter symbiosus]|uniref:aminotransferase class I/II-fold pyridoxal phosphate-dependent enzyme n=1 Tax=Candidatus Paracaedibacter symbiosus TaxID=244582 RepID=UPI0005094ED0|nr:aminotransferase class I/II-fold pyridoxal phosphate-dependent enzyme [Candidatus Paracaedibacter symbiosus]
MGYRNTNFIYGHSNKFYKKAVNEGLMQVTIQGRNGKKVSMPDNSEVVEFINCSYLGLDLHPDIIKSSKSLNDTWGVNFCCARSRFSIEPLQRLEEELSILFGGRAITFPSVTTTNISVLPLIASGMLLNPQNPPKVRMIFDKFAHSSMQFLKPILATESQVSAIPHNDLNALREEVMMAKMKGEVAVYVADGVYSMGGLCPIQTILNMSNELDFYVYLDDAHGTSIFGEYGQGSVLSQLPYGIPENLFISFCLSKGFGCNGGGILVPSVTQESTIRTYGQIYAFSAALDFSVANACLSSIRLHKDGTVPMLQARLRQNVALYDRLMELTLPFSPIRMVTVGDEEKAIELCKQILSKGFFVSVVFFPIVPRNKAQLRVCIAANHTEEQIRGLVDALKSILPSSWLNQGEDRMCA